MSEACKARDTRLNREVFIQVSNAKLASIPGRSETPASGRNPESQTDPRSPNRSLLSGQRMIHIVADPGVLHFLPGLIAPVHFLL